MIASFKDNGLDIDESTVRSTIGISKKAHIELLLDRINNHSPNIDGISKLGHVSDRIYERFLEHLRHEIVAHNDVVPGLNEVLDYLSDENIRIGSTTGYTRGNIKLISRDVASKGFAPECIVCSDEVAQGRPSPLMALTNMCRLGIWPAKHCIKVDDSIAGIQEGINANMWTVAVVLSGADAGLTTEQVDHMDPATLNAIVQQASENFYRSGCDFVIPTVRELPGVIQIINSTLSAA